MRGKKKGKKWIIIAVIVLLALIGGLRGGSKDAKPEDITEPTAEEIAEDVEDVEDVEDAAEEAAEEPETEAVKETAPDGISPELVEFLDSYEAFMDEYCEFMMSYNESDPAQLLKYASLMEKYYEFSKKAEAWNDENMTDEETLYYLKVMNRVNEKLLETGIAVG